MKIAQWMCSVLILVSVSVANCSPSSAQGLAKDFDSVQTPPSLPSPPRATGSSPLIDIPQVADSPQNPDSPPLTNKPVTPRLTEQRSANSPSYQLAPEKLIDVDFPGGSIAEYIDAVRKEADTMNIVVTESAASLKLPKIALKKVPVRAAIACIEHCFDLDKIRVQISGERGEVQFIQSQVLKRQEVEVVSIRHLVSDDKAKRADLLSAVEAGLEMYTESNSGLKIRLHEETGLLFLSGESHEIRLVKQIVSELSHSTSIAQQGYKYFQGGFNPAVQTPSGYQAADRYQTQQNENYGGRNRRYGGNEYRTQPDSVSPAKPVTPEKDDLYSQPRKNRPKNRNSGSSDYNATPGSDANPGGFLPGAGVQKPKLTDPGTGLDEEDSAAYLDEPRETIPKQGR